MSRKALPWLLISLVVALMFVVGIRLPLGDTASALLALIIAGIAWRIQKGCSE